MILVLFGPPGSGKGTQSDFLTLQGDFVHMSTGDLLRSEVEQGTELGLFIKDMMSRGEFLRDDLVVELVENWLDQHKGKQIICDGFPRTINQALAFDTFLGVKKEKVGLVVNLVVDLDQLIERISGRYSCKNCGAVYHDMNKRPVGNGVCDRCGWQEFVRRDDDRPDVLANRVQTYLDQTKAVCDYYKKKGLVKDLDASKDPASVSNELKSCLTQAGFKI
jgi:adenylate kinase